MLLAVARAGLLPVVIGEGEEDDLLAQLLLNGGKSGPLLLATGAGLANALTGGGPASLHDEAGLVADLLNNLELASDEGTGLLGGSVGVEVGVSVAGNDIDGVADGAHIVGLPSRDDIGGGVRTRVAGAAKLRLDVVDEIGKLANGAEAVEESLVTDDNEVNHVEAAPGLDGGDLLRDIGRAVFAADSADEDAENETETGGLSSGTDAGESVAVSRVDTEGGEASLGNGLDVGHDVGSGLALAVLGKGSVGHGPLVTLAAEVAGGRGGLRGDRGRSDRRLDLGDRGSDGDNGRRSNDGSGLGGGLRSLGRGNRRLNSGEGAVDNNVGLGDGGDDGGSRVGAGAVGLDDRDHNSDGLAVGDGGGDGSNGVGTSAGADVGGKLNDAGNNTILGSLGGGDGADNGGGSLDDGGDTTKSVGTARNNGRGGTADGLGLGQDHGGGGEGVGTRSRAGLLDRGGHGDGALGGGGRDHDNLGGARDRNRGGVGEDQRGGGEGGEGLAGGDDRGGGRNGRGGRSVDCATG